MTDRALRVFAVALLVAGLVLVLGGAFGGLAGLACVLVAQPVLSLAVGSWRGMGQGLNVDMRLRRDLPGLCLLWTASPALLATLTAWPVWSLQRDGSLTAALLLSVALAVSALVFWRTVLFWQSLVREGGPLSVRHPRLSEDRWQQWAGLAASTALLFTSALVLAPAVPLGELGQWSLIPAGISAVLCTLLHVAMQSLCLDGKPDAVQPAATAASVAEQWLADAMQPAGPLEPMVPSQWVPELYEAAREGRVDRAIQLIEAGADVLALPLGDSRDQRQLSVLAAVLPDLRLLRTLIAAGVDLNRSHKGMTALLAATRDSWHGRPEAVMTLLANGADVRLTDPAGNTALHFAARSADPSVAALLLDAAAGINSRNADGMTPLGIACQCGNWRMARFLLERGARPEVDGAVPALVAAAGCDDDDPVGVQLLLRHRARVDGRDQQHRSALHEAAAAGHVAVVEVLLQAGATLEARDVIGRTPWLDACAHGRVAVVEALLNHRPDVHALDAKGRNALWLASAADTGAASVVALVIEQGVRGDLADNDGRRPLDVAVAAGRWGVVALLDPAYPLPVAVSEQLHGEAVPNAEALATLPDRPPLALLREGLSQGKTQGMLDMLRLCSAQELGQLLHDASIVQQPNAVAWLLAHGADDAMLNSEGLSPAFVLLGSGSKGWLSLQALIGHGVSLAGEGGLARLLVAQLQELRQERISEQDVLSLFSRGLDVRGNSSAGDPPLSLAIRLGWLQLAAYLLERGVDREARDSQHLTALHLATALGDEAAIRLLVRHGANPQAHAPDGQTPLGVALSTGRNDLAEWLDWRIWPLPGRELQPQDLPGAAKSGDLAAVRRLLALALPVDAVDAHGCSALLHAAGAGHLEIVELLLAQAANPCLAATNGIFPLSAAVSMRQLAIVNALLQAGADIEQRLPGGVSVLMLAATLGLPDIVAPLLAAGADIGATDGKQLGALHCAAQFGFTAHDRNRLLALLDALLLAGADPNAAAAMELTPLLLMLGAGAETGTVCEVKVVLAGVDRLLADGASLHARDARGFTPLHLAALHGQSELVQYLLAAGGDPQVTDALGRTPREIALIRGFVDIASEFEPRVQPVMPLSRFLRDRV